MSEQIWRIGSQSPDEHIIAFSADEDPKLDVQLLPYDCIASKAHAQMLHEIGLISEQIWPELEAALNQAYAAATAGQLPISVQDEDGHTVLERFLTQASPEGGARIHTARSRNDQVIQALRLLVRDRLSACLLQTAKLVEALSALGQSWAQCPMPGFTHTRLAMPSSVGQLFFSYAESLLDAMQSSLAPLELSQALALGSASGYGVPLAIDRRRVAELLHCQRVSINSISIQNSRGVFETEVVHGLFRILQVLSRFADDMVMLSSESFGFITLPESMTTGSSIMPQKRNPDVFELMRAVPTRLAGYSQELMMLMHGMSSGYHRDVQRSKGPMMRALQETEQVLAIAQHALPQLKVNEAACRKSLDAPLMQTDAVYAQVRKGTAFRAAYRALKAKPSEPTEIAELQADVFTHRTHIGAPGTDQNAALCHRKSGFVEPIQQAQAAHRRCVDWMK